MLLWSAPLWFYLDQLPPLFFIIIFVIFTVAAIKLRSLQMQATSCNFLQAKPQIPRTVSLVKNPFSLILDESQPHEDTLENGINIKVKSEKSFWIVNYWGTNVTSFHANAAKSWDEIRHLILDNSFLEKTSLSSSKPQKYEPSDLETCIKPSTKLTPEMLGRAPRSCYPLVVVLAVDDSERDVSKFERSNITKGSKKSPPDDVVCLISIVHVKDTICPAETNIISQLAKLRSGRILCLKTLFTPGPSGSEKEETTSSCVICQDQPISRALLPCRHACVCGECYNLIDKCPLCRGYINSFFEIDESNDSVKESTLNSGESSHSNWQQTSGSTTIRETNPRRRFVPKLPNFLKFSSRG